MNAMTPYLKPVGLAVLSLLSVCVLLSVLSHFGAVILRPEDPRLTAVKVQEEIRDTVFYARAKRVVFVAFAAIGGGCALLLSVGGYRRMGVHSFKLGQHREIKVRWRDMPKLGYIAEGLILAEQMDAKAHAQEKAFELSMQLNRAITDGLKLTQSRGSKVIDVTPEQPKALPVPVPSFRELPKPEGRMTFGVDAQGQPVSMPVEQCYSMAFAGQSGSGKTSTLRNLIAQLLQVVECDIWIIDPHAGNDQSLLTSLGRLTELPNVHTCDRLEIKATVKNLTRMTEQAISSGKKMDRLQLIVIDEVKKLVELVPDVKSLIEKIGMESRKFNIFGLFSTQSWPAKMFDGSEVRDNLVTILSHRTKKRQALTLFDDNEVAKKVQKLKTGELLVTGNYLDEERIVTVPYCSLEDANEVFLQVNGATVNTQPARQSIDRSVFKTDPETLTPNTCKCVRDKLGFSQKALAGKAGISLSKLKRYELGQATWEADELNRIERVLFPQKLNNLVQLKPRELSTEPSEPHIN